MIITGTVQVIANTFIMHYKRLNIMKAWDYLSNVTMG